MHHPEVLVVTNRGDITADYVILELQERGIPYYRFNTEDYPNQIEITYDVQNSNSTLSLHSQERDIDLGAIKAAWYRRPGLPHIDERVSDSGYREYLSGESLQLLKSLYSILDCKWLNHPLAIGAAEAKPYQLKIACQTGLAVPRTVITNSANRIRRFFAACGGDIVVKPVKSGVVRSQTEEHVAYTSKVREEDLRHIDSAKFGPAIYQEYVPKRVDIRVTVVGSTLFPVAIHSQEQQETQVDWRRGERVDLRHEEYRLPENIRMGCLQLMRRLNLGFGALDFVEGRDGHIYFLEVNPNGQWAWIQERTSMNIGGAIVDYLVRQDEGHS